MKKILLLLLVCLPIAMFAQTDEKYLEGAVPVSADGKVTFSTQLQATGMDQETIYSTILEWANKRFQPGEKLSPRILFKDEGKGNIAIGGEEYLVFSSNALSLDRTRIYYHLIIDCAPGKCDLSISRIRYWYDEARDGGEKYTAEEWIVDKMGLNKSKTKLAPICGKFRRKTIDLKDELFQEIRSTLGNKMISMGIQAAPVKPEAQVAVVPAQPAVQPVVPQETTAVSVAPAPKAPATATTETTDQEALIQSAVRMTITAGNDEQFEANKESWGGFGEIIGKKVVFCLIDTQKTMANMLMAQSENYKISFYQANSNEPSVVINCKKVMQQAVNGDEAKKMNPNLKETKSYNMYVGEIIK